VLTQPEKELGSLSVAYVVDIEYDFDCRPFRDAFGSYVVTFVLGGNEPADLIVVMSIAFLPQYGGKLYDLVFGIEERELSKDGWLSGRSYDIETSKHYVPRIHRPKVLDMVISAIDSILKEAQPHKVMMKSFHRHLPHKAMRKYERICRTMKANGYETKEDFRDETTHRHYWLFERTS
jgi:hypothetical protein